MHDDLRHITSDPEILGCDPIWLPGGDGAGVQRDGSIAWRGQEYVRRARLSALEKGSHF
jgi:hypothetical protein